MTDVFMYALAISSMYFIFKFLEMKFSLEEDKKPLKIILKETILVYCASISGIYMYSQFDTNNLKGGTKATMAFVDNPSF
jgi:hypothetical protein